MFPSKERLVPVHFQTTKMVAWRSGRIETVECKSKEEIVV